MRDPLGAALEIDAVLDAAIERAVAIVPLPCEVLDRVEQLRRAGCLVRVPSLEATLVAEDASGQR